MKLLDSGQVSFQSEGRLLQELGERLVASPEVAILELIKNAYDADASECRIELPDERSLTITDDGHGMTLDDFKNKWMRIATGTKLAETYSRQYNRKLTGAKGIGRFAVRYLGRKLHLESIAYDSVRKTTTKLIADFDWSEFDKAAEMSTVSVPFKLENAGGTKTGTILTIQDLHAKSDKVFSKTVNTEVLKIVSPLAGLETGKFARARAGRKQDPGFSVVLPTSSTEEPANLAGQVLSSYWARLVIELDGNELDYKIFFQGKPKAALKHHLVIKNRIRAGLFADIRFLPRRPGIFSKKGFDGRDAWKWVMLNSGVAVVDHGFRMKPYGYGDDDWLKLSQDSARNLRDWRSDIAKESFPIPPEIKKKPSLNPMLYLPANHQLVGAVFVESGHEGSAGKELDLTPSTDREGYLRNPAFEQLFEIVRAGIEMLAVADKREVERLEAEEAKKAAERARADIRLAIRHVERSTTLTQADKNRIISAYTGLARNIDEVDEYHRRARQSLEIMSLLGVVAGFMTHESRRILRALERAITTVRRLSQSHRELRQHADELEDAFSEFSGHVDYTATFVEAVQRRQELAFKARAQIERITRKFKSFLHERNISVSIEIDPNVDAPPTQVALYSGIVLNLYTNAIKAVIAGHAENAQPKIVFKGWNENGRHVLEVVDNGVGIPPEIEQRIWDPLFTTTSSLNNPMGTGMGLGLSLVKKLVTDVGGSIRLVKPPPGFSTCFRMELPRPS